MELRTVLTVWLTADRSKPVSETQVIFSFSLCAKFCANVCNNDRVMAVKANFKIAAAAILDFVGFLGGLLAMHSISQGHSWTYLNRRRCVVL